MAPRRHDRQRHHERAEKSEEDGRSHRPEQFAFDAGERQDRQVHDGDNRLPEHARGSNLERRFLDDVHTLGDRHRRLRARLGLGEATRRVLHDDDRAVDDQAEVDGAEAHQVSRDPRRAHEEHGEQHRERDGDRDDDARPQIAEQQEEDAHDQRRADEEVLADRVNRVIDELRAVVKRLDERAWWKRALERRELGLHRVCHGARVLAHEHHGDSDRDFAVPVTRGRAAPQPSAESHVTHGRHSHGHALRGRADDDVADVVRVLHQAFASDDEVLFVVLDVAAAGVGVRLLHRIRDLRDRDPGREEPLRIQHDLVLAVFSSEGVDLDHTRHRA
jgi:hypothetical protein